MHKAYLLSLLFLAFGCVADAQEAAKGPITLDELNNRQVVGTLGKPLGTVVEIEAKVIEGSELRLKQFDGEYLLRVTHVDGNKLDQPAVLQFSTGFSVVELANDDFSLYELKHHKKASSLNSSQISELQKGYVGRSVRLAVYEVGSFRGVPKGLPKDVLTWADVSFHFDTSLVILAGREKTTDKGRKGR
jgi:hypothetical protein